MKWKVSGNRFIAFFDIKGFKDYVIRNNHSDIYKKLQKIHSLSKFLEKGAKDYSGKEVKIISFSDSTLIVTNGISYKDFSNITILSKSFINIAINYGMPIMGAISMGYFTADTENSIYFGQPLIDAYNLSEELCYYGLVLDCKTEEYVNSKFEKNYDYMTFLTDFKKGHAFHKNLDYVSKAKEIDLKTSIINLYNSVSGNKRKYVDNTLKMFDAFMDNYQKENSTNEH